MNTATQLIEAQDVPASSRLAGALRWLGGLAVLCAAGVFMLQGFDNITAELRDWAFIVLMVSCAGAAFMTQRLFGDAKSARVLSGLAVLLVPVQFSQLGGMLHEAMMPVAENASAALGVIDQWLPVLGSPAALLAMVASTVALGLLVVKAGFSVLVRSHARSFSYYMAGFLALLLIPARDSVLGLLVLLTMAGGYFLALRQLNHQQSALATFEGRSALALLALPLIIAAIRFALHADSLGALCALVGVISVLLVEAPRRLFSSNIGTRFLALIGLFGVANTWMVYSLEVFAQAPSSMAHTLTVLPIAAYWAESSRHLGGAGFLARFGSSVLMLMLCVSLLQQGAFSSALMLFAISGVYLAWSVYRQLREPTLFGAVLLTLASLQVLYLALVDVQLNGWLILAVGGLLLVVGASAIERHGQRLLQTSRNAWLTVRKWA